MQQVTTMLIAPSACSSPHVDVETRTDSRCVAAAQEALHPEALARRSTGRRADNARVQWLQCTTGGEEAEIRAACPLPPFPVKHPVPLRPRHQALPLRDGGTSRGVRSPRIAHRGLPRAVLVSASFPVKRGRWRSPHPSPLPALVTYRDPVPGLVAAHEPRRSASNASLEEVRLSVTAKKGWDRAGRHVSRETVHTPLRA